MCHSLDSGFCTGTENERVFQKKSPSVLGNDASVLGLDEQGAEPSLEATLAEVHINALDFLPGTANLSGFKSTVVHAWKKWCDAVVGDKLSDYLTRLIFSKKFFMKKVRVQDHGSEEHFQLEKHDTLQDYVVSSDDASTMAGSQDGSAKTGFQDENTYWLFEKGASAVLTDIIERLQVLKKFAERVDGNDFSQIIFDHLCNIKWQLGYCPKVRFATDNDGGIDADLKSPKGEKWSYSAYVPCPYSMMWTNKTSAPVFCYADSEAPGMKGPRSTLVDVSALSRGFLGLEEIYVTEKTGFFIDNITTRNLKAENTLLSFLLRHYALACEVYGGSNGGTNVGPISGRTGTVAKMGSGRNSGRRSDGFSEGIFSLNSRFPSSDFSTTADSLNPPCMSHQDLYLRPLLLVRGSKIATLPQEITYRETEDDHEDEDKSVIESPDYAYEHTSLKELKLLQNRGVSFVVPILWQNLLRVKIPQNCKRMRRASIVEVHVDPEIIF